MCCPQIFERLHLEGFTYCFCLSSYRGYVGTGMNFPKGRKSGKPLFRDSAGEIPLLGEGWAGTDLNFPQSRIHSIRFLGKETSSFPCISSQGQLHTQKYVAFPMAMTEAMKQAFLGSESDFSGHHFIVFKIPNRKIPRVKICKNSESSSLQPRTL